MLFGKFDSKTGIYTFKDRTYQAVFYANSLREPSIQKIYDLCIQGYESSHANMPNWPKTVLVTYQPRWNEIFKSYPGLYAQSQIHFYDPNTPVGTVPNWALPWAQNGSILLHEYAPGEVAWLRDESNFDDDVYIFFNDCDPAEGSNNDGGSVLPVPSFKSLSLTGKIGIKEIDLLLKFEE